MEELESKILNLENEKNQEAFYGTEETENGRKDDENGN